MSQLPLDRREFHSNIAKGAALLGLTAATAHITRADESTPAEAEKGLPPAALIVELTKQTFPHDRMSEDFLTALQSHVDLTLSYSQTLDSFGLTNGDPPGPIMFLG